MISHYIDHALFLQSTLPLISVISNALLKWLLSVLKMGDLVRSSGWLLSSESAGCQPGTELLPLIFRSLWKTANTFPGSQLPFQVSFSVCVFLLVGTLGSLFASIQTMPWSPVTSCRCENHQAGDGKEKEGGGKQETLPLTPFLGIRGPFRTRARLPLAIAQ